MAEFNQVHEPVSELSQEVRAFARMIAALVEQTEERVEGQGQGTKPGR